MEQDLAGKDIADHGAAKLAGEALPLVLALSEPALLWKCSSFWVRRLTAQVLLSRVKLLSPHHTRAGAHKVLDCRQTLKGCLCRRKDPTGYLAATEGYEVKATGRSVESS